MLTSSIVAIATFSVAVLAIAGLCILYYKREQKKQRLPYYTI